MQLAEPQYSATFVFMLLAFTLTANADSFSAVFVYGDSLSDNGNLFAATGFPPAPYFDGRFSNGPVAAEQLAALLGVSTVDFAWGGATTGLGNQADGGTQTMPGSAPLPECLPNWPVTPFPRRHPQFTLRCLGRRERFRNQTARRRSRSATLIRSSAPSRPRAQPTSSYRVSRSRPDA